MNRNEILEQFSQLLDVMNDLRAKCPWDKEQTWDSIRTLSIEEVHELSDAIMSGDVDEVKKELGDLLLHIVFYSKIASEKDYFDVGEVCKTLIEKLIRRHPHIYGDVKADDTETVLQNWEQIKLQEKGKKKNGVLDGVPKGLNSMVKAYRMQEKASQVGFDWDDAELAYEKVEEEWKEFKEAQTPEHQEEEFGDYLFSLVNYARLRGINPDTALERCNIKFKRRFQSMEAQAEDMGKSLKDMTLAEMEELYAVSKQQERGE
jgi:XTP/dITP diphosphohydrolase